MTDPVPADAVEPRRIEAEPAAAEPTVHTPDAPVKTAAATAGLPDLNPGRRFFTELTAEQAAWADLFTGVQPNPDEPAWPDLFAEFDGILADLARCADDDRRLLDAWAQLAWGNASEPRRTRIPA
jgi:hypothetical protein